VCVCVWGVFFSFFFFLKGSGAAGPRTISFNSGSFSSIGLSLNSSTGLVSGTPTSGVGNVGYVLAVTDSQGATGSSSDCVLQVFAAPTISCPTGAAVVTAPYSSSFTVSGGASIVSFSLIAGSNLPPGLSFNSATRVVSGVPTASGVFSFQVQLQDAALANVVSPSCSVTVASAPTLQCPLAFSTKSSSYSSALLPSGGSQTG
jgi:hypothetical protein